MLTDVIALTRCTFIQADHHFNNRVGCRSQIISWTKLWSSNSIWQHKTSFYCLKRARSFQFPLTESVCKSCHIKTQGCTHLKNVTSALRGALIKGNYICFLGCHESLLLYIVIMSIITAGFPLTALPERLDELSYCCQMHSMLAHVTLGTGGFWSGRTVYVYIHFLQCFSSKT